jgi:hypothetical protein
VVQPTVETNNEINTEEWGTVSGVVDKQATYYTSLWRQGQREESIGV